MTTLMIYQNFIVSGTVSSYFWIKEKDAQTFFKIIIGVTIPKKASMATMADRPLKI